MRVTTRKIHTDTGDFARSQFCAAMALAVGLPALTPHVGHIVGLSAEEQMRRIYAGRRVTLVKD